MIPQENCAGVTRGLRETFGVTEFEDIRRLPNGLMSNPVFRIVVRGSPYLLRINTRRGDLACHFACMKAADGAGLAPHVWYTSVEDRISITNFVDAVPLPPTEALIWMPAALRALHSLPPFPARAHHLNTSCTFLMHKGTALDGFLQRFQSAKVLPESERKELLAIYAQVAAACPHDDSDMVSSHNDLFKPDNILFDGRRVWLVDWEAAFLNDRYADLAVVANLLVTNAEEERAYLQEYFGRSPDEYQLARLFLMRQVGHIFYAMAFLLLGSAGKPIDWNEPVPEFSDFHRRFWSGEVNLTGNGAKTTFGRVHWDQLFKNTRQPRFNEALRIASDRHGPC